MSGRRRDIGNSVVFFGLLLILLIGYLGWFKRGGGPPAGEELPTGQTVVVSSGPLEPPAPPAPPAPIMEPPRPDVSDQRTIEPAPPPASPHAETLAAIASLIEQGDDEEARLHLLELPRDLLLSSEHRRYVATLWNNLGVLQAQRHGPEEAIPSYVTGLDLAPKNPALNLNLAQAYWAAQDDRLTPHFLEKLIALVPEEPFPRIALAEVRYRQDDFTGAARALKQAAPLVKTKPQLTGYFDMVQAKLTSARQTEDGFRARHSTHFVVKFDGAEDYTIWDDVLDILEEAYGDVGRRFGYFPTKPIHVVLLTQEKFQGMEGTPAWADALYDPVLGRIRVPTRGADTDRAWLRRVLRHEYVHAMIHERMGLEIASVPTWLNEGLAMQLADDTWKDLDQLARNPDLKLHPLPTLEKGWGSFSMEEASLAYLEANSATRFMIDRYGMARVRDMLDRLKAGHTFSGALNYTLMVPYEVFQKRWTQDLEARMTARPS